MTARYRYDETLDPPAPIVPVRISTPGGDDAVMLPMLVDTGADCTLVPRRIVQQLRLPRVDVIAVTGVGGGRQRTTVHVAAVDFGGHHELARVVAFAEEAILGRDLINQAVVVLDGPARAISIRRRSRPRRAQRSR